MFKFMGVIGVALGFLLMKLYRRGEGCGSAFFFLLGLAVFGFGLYLFFFEDGQGAARWFPFLKP